MKKFLLSLCVVLALIACKDEKKDEQADTIPVVKIGVLYPLSGDGAIYGEAAKNAVDIFFEDFNKKSPKFKYQLIFEDNQNQLAKQATLAKKLIYMDNVDVIVTVMSNFGAVVSPIAEKNKILHISTATDPSVAIGKYNIIASSNPIGEIDLLYNTLIQKKAKNVDIVLANVSGTEMLLRYLKQKNDERKALNINQIYYTNVDEKDFRTMFHKIKENKPDYIIALLAMPTIDIFMRQYHENQINIPVTGIETFSYLQNKELAENMWYVDAAPATDDYVQKYQAKTGSAVTNYAEYMDFILQIITFGYEGAGTTDRKQVADYIENNAANQHTAVGTISTAPDGFLYAEPVIRRIISGQSIIVKE